MDFTPFILLAVFIFGCCIGSFLNVLIWRLPRDHKITGRSQCPHCKHVLQWYDLLPVVSYLLSGARCRYCRQTISWRYPLIEVITGIMFVCAYLLVLPAESGLVADWLVVVSYWFVLAVLLVVFVVDYEHYLILDKVVYPATIVILALNLLVVIIDGQLSPSIWHYLTNSAFGIIGGFIPFYLLWKVSKGKWMGLGDAKLGLFLGAVFGFPQIWLLYFVAFISGTIFSLPLLLTGKKELTSRLPFGTFLTIAAVVTIWFGERIANWYFGLIGVV